MHTGQICNSLWGCTNMLSFSTQQMRAFRSVPRALFVDRMRDHLQQFFHAHCKALGPNGLDDAIHHGIDRAKVYGIVGQRDVCLYIDLMFSFGRDFDKDSKLPWVCEILTDRRRFTAKQRIDDLHARAITELSRVGR